MRYKCLVLDHDDTAVDSTPAIHYPAHLEIMRKLRPEAEPVSLAGWMMKNFNPGIMEFLVGELEFTQAELDEEYRIWRTYTKTITPRFFPGFVEALRDFRLAGGKIAVVSHSEPDIIRTHYGTQGMSPDLVFGWTYDEAKRKPNPWPVLKIIEILKLDPRELLAVDDLKPGVVMAHNAGISVGAAGWSHKIEAIERYMRRNCQVFFESVADFRQHILA